MYPRLSSKHSLKKLRTHLQRGGLVAYPTESCYGIGCSPRHARALSRVIKLKKRPQHKGLITIGCHLEQLQKLLQPLPERTYKSLNEIWPAAKTFILPCPSTILPALRGKRRNKLAVRIPDHPAARHLCQTVAMPLVSTSCNRAGGQPCRHEREVRRLFGKRLWIIGNRIGKRKQPSEIIDWSSGQHLR